MKHKMYKSKSHPTENIVNAELPRFPKKTPRIPATKEPQSG